MSSNEFVNRDSEDIWRSIVYNKDLNEEDIKEFYVSWSQTVRTNINIIFCLIENCSLQYDRDLAALNCKSFIRLNEKICQYFPDQNVRGNQNPSGKKKKRRISSKPEPTSSIKLTTIN